MSNAIRRGGPPLGDPIPLPSARAPGVAAAAFP